MNMTNTVLHIICTSRTHSHNLYNNKVYVAIMSRNLLTDYQMFKHNSNELYNIQVPHFEGHQIAKVTGPP